MASITSKVKSVTYTIIHNRRTYIVKCDSNKVEGKFLWSVTQTAGGTRGHIHKWKLTMPSPEDAAKFVVTHEAWLINPANRFVPLAHLKGDK